MMISPARLSVLTLPFVATWLATLSWSALAVADVANLDTVQTRYSDPMSGNAVLMIWDEPTPNPSGVEILVDGVSLGELGGGIGAVEILAVEAGTHTFRVQSIDNPASFSEKDQDVVDAQPFTDVENVQCQEGPTDPITGLCELVVSWENPGPVPQFYGVFLDDGAEEQFLGTLEGTNETLTIVDLDPGSYIVTLVGLTTEDIGSYRGQFIETTCSVTCGDPGFTFLRGDCDGNGVVEGNVNDAIFLLFFNFVGGDRPTCMAACDADGNGVVEGNVNDAIFLLFFNFVGGAPPGAPFPVCGPPDLPSDELLGCEMMSESCAPPAN